ncbi:autotransporter domain-containing protein [Bradyrhizobium sp. CB1650]|uniref:autotransporter outer membrane beta-barrel domain-containing protein n=1 Tax=Bradyrhizobium sp. CB1650 TaxID=3039153 RepID=UPI0024347ED0|nr:autotransporter domain-containing protein [Bradyrhizobium sp. CB1650]WGD55896.1 autotransporter domain-containing protein [Bradyrhizobium sp. CB1650]
MKTTNGSTRHKPLHQATFNTRRSWGVLTIAATLSVAGLVPAPAMAACVQSGNVVTCSGASSTGFGSGIESNLALTVAPGASITVPSNVNAIDLGAGNTAVNNGAISVGDNAAGMQGSGNNNTFTNAGTIAIGSDAAGIFMLGNHNSVSNTGAITGSTLMGVGIDVLGTGNVATNSGTVTLTGTASTGISANATGNTIQNSGTITIGGANGTNGQGVFLLDSNTLINSGTIHAAGDDSVGVNIWGNGNTLTNSGTIVATGAFGLAVGFGGTGNTLVNNGTIKGGPNGYALFSFGTTGNVLTNNGTLDGAMFFIGTGSSLTNNGLVTITDPATALAPGNIGFGGAFIQSGQGTLALRVDSAGHRDGLYAQDQAQLGGTLRAVVQAGLYQPTTIYAGVVQSAGAVTGQFGAVTSSSAFFNAAATYNANSVDLTLTRQGFGAVAGETANQRAVGNALEAGYSPSLTGAAATFYSQLLQAGSVGVLDKLSGEGTSGTQNTAFAAGTMFAQTMDGQMNAWRAGTRGNAAGSGALGYAEARPATSAFNALKAPPLVEPQWHAWASGFGAGQSLSGDAAVGSAAFSDRVAGGAVGVDHLLGPDLLVGVAAGGSSATFKVDDRATSGRLDGAHLGAYAMRRFGATYVSGQLAYSHFNNSTTRAITGVGADEIAKGAFGSDQFGGRLEVGRTYDFGPVAVTPFAALQAARLWQAGYTETSVTGAGPGVLGLSYAARSVSSLPLFLGSKFDARFDLGNGMMWMPFASLAWVHEFSPTRDVTATLVSMPVPAFTVEGARAASDAGRVELGSRLVLNRWSELSARFTGEFSNVGQSYAGTGTWRVSW